ncbi:condensation domain-containing protein, partial [Streptomyces parvus]|uniref:condensation domain-containing protein n=1 Tax=Streptomyces parvus TaxID=66428 RepID=UPI0021CC5B43
QRLQAEQAELRQYEYSPLADVQRWSDVQAGDPLFETLFVYENFPLSAAPDAVQRQTLTFEVVESRGHTNYPLTVVAVPGDGITVHAFYDERRFDAEAIERVLSSYLRLLTELASADVSRMPVDELSVLTHQDRLQLLTSWNDSAVEVRPGLVHELVAERARLCPGAVAVSYEGRVLS